MEITKQPEDGMMDCDMQDDDLMGLELAEMEAKAVQAAPTGLKDLMLNREAVNMALKRVSLWAFRPRNLRFFFEDLHIRDHLCVMILVRLVILQDIIIIVRRNRR